MISFTSSPYQRGCKGIDPGDKVITDPMGKSVTLIAEREDAYQANPAAGKEIIAYVVEHLPDAFDRIGTFTQRFKDMASKPCIDLGFAALSKELFCSVR